MLLDSDTTWVHINQAVRCDSTNGNAWMFLCVESMLRRKYDLMQRSARTLEETGFLTKAILSYGRWMMRTLPEKAILITNGDMDTFPLLVLQTAEGFRTDVAVVKKQWLGLKQYLSYLQDHRDVSLPLKESQIDSLFGSTTFPDNMLLVADAVFAGWGEQKETGTLDRPLAIAVTVLEDFYTDVRDHLRYAGPFLLWQSQPVADSPDTLALHKSLEGIRIEEFRGPWVSDRDTSPVRMMFTKELSRNVTGMILVYCEELIKAEKYEKAEHILDYSEEFERTTELGPVSVERISDLRSEIKEKLHDTDEIDRGTWIERGQSSLLPVKKKLMAELLNGLKEGPEAAIDVCRFEAPKIAEEVSSPNVKLGRTSHRLRNRSNAPKKWMQSLPKVYAEKPGKSDPEVVVLDGGSIGYVEPIYVKGMCLVCHGKDLSLEIASRLDRYYPQDEARGFEEGDFRGLFWVEFTDVE